jgi:hypothetical protein
VYEDPDNVSLVVNSKFQRLQYDVCYEDQVYLLQGISELRCPLQIRLWPASRGRGWEGK